MKVELVKLLINKKINKTKIKQMQFIARHYHFIWIKSNR